MNFTSVLSFDPSGNFEEGKGTTGVCLFDCKKHAIKTTNIIRAINFDMKESYWQAHIDLIDKYWEQCNQNMVLVIEEYMLDPTKAMQQSYSKMETSKLIGIIQTHCFLKHIPYVMQRPTDVKTRWADHILVHKEIISRPNKRHFYLPDGVTILNEHCRDAIRHAVHFATFKNKES